MDRTERGRRWTKALMVCAWLASAPAWASGSDGARNLDIYQGPLLSSGRIVGLGGAFVGVAEGQDGEPFNVSSLAHRNRRIDRWWDWDFVFSVDVPLFHQPFRQDFDLDGKLDPGERSNTQLGVMLQIHRIGFGLLVRELALSGALPDGSVLDLATQDVALGVAYGFWDEEAIIGLELAIGTGIVQRYGGDAMPAGAGLLGEAGYSGFSLRPGILWRPRGKSYRFGLQVDPGRTLTPSEPELTLEGVELPATMINPMVISVGGSMWFGPNAHHYNAPSPQAMREMYDETRRRERHELAPLPEFDDGGLQPVMVTVQVDLVDASPNAIGMGSYVRQGQRTQSGAPLAAPISGGAWTAALRGGAEWEALADWLILRGGTYLEPSRFGIEWRPHGTFGFDVKIPFWPVDLRFSSAADIASRYQNITFSLGLWHSVGPMKPMEIASAARVPASELLFAPPADPLPVHTSPRTPSPSIDPAPVDGPGDDDERVLEPVDLPAAFRDVTAS